MALVPGVEDGVESIDEKRGYRVREKETAYYCDVRAPGHGGYETFGTFQEERASGQIVHDGIRGEKVARSHRRGDDGKIHGQLV